MQYYYGLSKKKDKFCIMHNIAFIIVSITLTIKLNKILCDYRSNYRN